MWRNIHDTDPVLWTYAEKYSWTIVTWCYGVLFGKSWSRKICSDISGWVRHTRGYLECWNEVRFYSLYLQEKSPINCTITLFQHTGDFWSKKSLIILPISHLVWEEITEPCISIAEYQQYVISSCRPNYFVIFIICVIYAILPDFPIGQLRSRYVSFWFEVTLM